MRATARGLFPIIALLSALLLPGPARAVVIFSAGMLTPETISQVPEGFGNLGGSYLIPDAARNLDDPSLHNVWIVPQGGGAPAIFSTGNVDDLLAGVFLPPLSATPLWGDSAGRFLTVGRDTAADGTLIGVVYTYAPDGTRELFQTYPSDPFNQALIAPAGFGTLGGQLVVSESKAGGVIGVISGDKSITNLVNSPLLTQAFGLAFAPDDFGGFGGKLLASDPNAGTIIALDPDGAAAAFANIPLLSGQTGLRQMAFAPRDFLFDLGIPGDLLLVSVSGSQNGGGTQGDILALNTDGEVVASLRVIDDLDKFDPRGMLFQSDGSLLISDTADPILLVTADDFRPGRFGNVPEPSMVFLIGIGLAGIGSVRMLSRERQTGRA